MRSKMMAAAAAGALLLNVAGASAEPLKLDDQQLDGVTGGLTTQQGQLITLAVLAAVILPGCAGSNAASCAGAGVEGVFSTVELIHFVETGTFFPIPRPAFPGYSRF